MIYIVLLFCFCTFEIRTCRARRTALYADSSDSVIASYKVARKIVEARWDNATIEKLPCLSPRLHGHVQKLGTGQQSPTITIGVAESETYIFEKLPIYAGCQVPFDDVLGANDRSSRTFADVPWSAVVEFRKKSPGLQVYQSDKWEFIFIRQPKSSSTAVLHSITTSLCIHSAADGEAGCEPNELRLVDSVKTEVWQKYFVFTFVRNPWTRLLSAYRMFHQFFLRKCVIHSSRL
jgi:hypothetical protein